jgi:hypothetical protein
VHIPVDFSFDHLRRRNRDAVTGVRPDDAVALDVVSR